MTDTTGRMLRLLGLLQSRTLWTAEELAERLRVTPRSVRRDVGRLRDLGYPVRASRGVGGGYQLGAGRALPPLLLDPEEAVAVAVSLRLAAGGSVAGVDDAAMRALAKLDQVLPARLRERVTAVQEATVTVPWTISPVDPETLTTLARACRDRVRVRMSYTKRGVQEPGQRDVQPHARNGRPDHSHDQADQRHLEPYRLVSLGQRWYLLAFDLDRDDWRSFRLDRISALAATTLRFTPRAAPDAAAYVRDAVTRSAYRHVARVRLDAPADEVAERIPAAAATVTALGPDRCEVVTGADQLDWIALHLALIGAPIEVVEPPELAALMGRLGQLLLRASESTSASASTT